MDCGYYTQRVRLSGWEQAQPFPTPKQGQLRSRRLFCACATPMIAVCGKGPALASWEMPAALCMFLLHPSRPAANTRRPDWWMRSFSKAAKPVQSDTLFQTFQVNAGDRVACHGFYTA